MHLQERVVVRRSSYCPDRGGLFVVSCCVYLPSHGCFLQEVAEGNQPLKKSEQVRCKREGAF